MAFGVMQHLDIVVCPTSDEAHARGFHKDGLYKGATPVAIEHVVIVKAGTQGGNPTVDLMLKDPQGNTYVVMVTGALLRSLPL